LNNENCNHDNDSKRQNQGASPKQKKKVGDRCKYRLFCRKILTPDGCPFMHIYSEIPCKNGIECKNHRCQYGHQKRVQCKNGPDCLHNQRGTCPFAHGE
jgi:hypothetical protein